MLAFSGAEEKSVFSRNGAYRLMREIAYGRITLEDNASPFAASLAQRQRSAAQRSGTARSVRVRYRA